MALLLDCLRRSGAGGLSVLARQVACVGSGGAKHGQTVVQTASAALVAQRSVSSSTNSTDELYQVLGEIRPVCCRESLCMCVFVCACLPISHSLTHSHTHTPSLSLCTQPQTFGTSSNKRLTTARGKKASWSLLLAVRMVTSPAGTEMEQPHTRTKSKYCMCAQHGPTQQSAPCEPLPSLPHAPLPHAAQNCNTINARTVLPRDSLNDAHRSPRHQVVCMLC